MSAEPTPTDAQRELVAHLAAIVHKGPPPTPPVPNGLPVTDEY